MDKNGFMKISKVEKKKRIVPQIVWGIQWEKKHDAWKIKYLKDLTSSQNDALDNRQKEANKNALLNKLLNEQVVELQKTINAKTGFIAKTVQDANNERNILQQEIQKKSEIIREFRLKVGEHNKIYGNTMYEIK